MSFRFTEMTAVAVIGLVAARGAVAEAIKPGQELKRTINPGETHSYDVSLAEGQYLRFALEYSEFENIKLVVKLLRPNGDAVIGLETSQQLSPVTLSLLANSRGVHRLNLQMVSGKPAREYAVRLVEARAAVTADSRKIEAETMLREGRLLYGEGTASSRRAAIPKFQTAIAVARETGDRLVEKSALRNLGTTYNALGEPPSALKAYGEVLEFARKNADRPLEAEAYNNVGLTHTYLGDYAQAVADLKTAIQIWEQLGKAAERVPPTNNLALAYIYLGELETARRTYEEAFRILNDTKGDPVSLGIARAGIASASLLQGRYQDALDDYGQALEIWRQAKSRQNEAVALGNIGATYLRLGEPQLALRNLEQALEIRRAMGDRAAEANALQNLGSAYQMMGRPELALENSQRALEIFESIGRRTDQATVLNRLGALRSQTAHRSEATEQFSRARAISQQIGDRRMQVIATLGLGQQALTAGQPGEALKLASEALQVAESEGYRPEQEGILVLMARAEMAKGALDRARERMEAALEIAESIRSSLASSDFRQSYFVGVRNRYDLLIDILMRQRREAEAFAVSERARARSLLEMLGESRSDIHEGVNPELLEREKQIRAALRVKIAAPESKVQKLVLDYREVSNAIRAQNPRYASLTLPEALRLSEVQSEILDAETLLLEYALGEERSYVWAVTRDSVTARELPSRSKVEAAGRAAFKEMSTHQGTGAVKALSRMLVAPVAAKLGHHRLVVVTEGALQYIPFAALTTADGKPLAAAHEVVSLPSAATVRALRQQSARRVIPSQTAAVFGDPVFARNDSRLANLAGGVSPEKSNALLERSAQDTGFARFERLPSTRAEAEAIAGYAGASRSRTFLDFDASWEAATSPELADYRIVHFATHGLLNNRHPELSGLVFSLVDKQGNPRNGFLQAFEVYNLRLSADLVVLSACQTAVGQDVKGEGLLGLSRGFMYAGAQRVVASLWKVPDRASAELMKYFYRGMLVNGLRPAAALRAAQAVMRKNPRTADPYYWAGFILQGEWN